MNYATVLVVALCWVTIVFDGYDLNVYGAVVPSLLENSGWGLTPVEAGAIGSYAFFGMLLGALLVGTVTDVIGRKKALIICIVWYSIAMGLCALAPTPEFLSLMRFIAGLGLGGVLPTATALTTEYAPRRWRTVVYALMFSGFPLGAVLAASLAIPIIPAFGWRVMFLIGIAPLFVVVPLALRFMPESASFLLSQGRRTEAEALARRYGVAVESEEASPARTSEGTAGRVSWLRGLSTLFRREYVVGTLLFWAATFMALLMIFGMNTWLPQIMREAGYPLGSALSFLLILNLGGAFGALFTAAATDKFGAKPVCVVSFLLALMSIGLLSFQMPLLALYPLLILAGVGTHGTQLLVNAYVSRYYPASSRATALGWSLGIGRLGAVCGPLLGGLVLGLELEIRWSFYAFALPGLFGAVFIMMLPDRRPATELQEEPETVMVH